ncbi:MAG: hypothetical protein V1723_01625 [Candidatus Uhrbacteria bacterium]
MAAETRTEEKPPAHEVILEVIESIARGQSEGTLVRVGIGELHAVAMGGFYRAFLCLDLLEILGSIAIPRSDLKAVIDRVRALQIHDAFEEGLRIRGVGARIAVARITAELGARLAAASTGNAT